MVRDSETREQARPREWPDAPTPEQCEANAEVDVPACGKGVAFWHPQWGGYTARAIMVPYENGDCFDVYVWHDGEFPRNDKPPREYHYCDSDQLRKMADLADRIAARGPR